MDNFFYKKFQDKTDEELKKILAEKENYTLEALTTAYNILKERNLSVEEFSFIEQEIQQSPLEEETTKTDNITTNTTSDIALFSKKTILGFSIFFSTIFGVVLLMINMQQVKSEKGKNQVLFFGIAYLLFTILMIQIFKTSSMLGLFFNLLGATILNEYYWNKFIGKETQYQKRNWLKPALISLCIVGTFFIIAFYIL